MKTTYSLSYGYNNKAGSFGQYDMDKISAINEAMSLVELCDYDYCHVYWHGCSGTVEKIITFYSDEF